MLPWLAVSERKIRLFAYGSLLPGERDSDLLRAARQLGPARTPAIYHLVELPGFPALLSGGRLAVEGELYAVTREELSAIDVRKEHPILFHRETIELESGDSAEAYLMTFEQLRGRRRLRVGDWRKRFSPPAAGIPESPWARRAKRY